MDEIYTRHSEDAERVLVPLTENVAINDKNTAGSSVGGGQNDKGRNNQLLN